MKILITGDKGFVGRAFRRLYGDNHDITGCDIKDSRDFRNFAKSRSHTTYDLVIHLAAVVGGRQTIEGNPLSVATDLAIDSDLFNWAVRTRQKRIVYFSSSAAYPIELQTPERGHRLRESDINLDDIRSPDLTYGWTKLTGEYLAQFARAEGIPVHVFRPFSGYGADQDLDYPFPAFIDRAKRHANPFQIWGDGHQVRDFIQIDDVVRCVDAALDQDYQGPLNIGWGRATTFNELQDLVCSMAGYHPRVQHLKTKPVGVQFRVAEVSNMLRVYQPKITLEEGIRRALMV